MSRHLLIAGTGRTGTSFLVRYLTRLGLDTTLSRHGPDAIWDETANAGLETLPSDDAGLPYVVKSPWTYQVIHQVLSEGKLQFDAVILPMRDLTEAAASRTIIETQSLHNSLDWMGNLNRTWEHFGHTPGGVVYSLSPVDQARLLAVGFHQLLDALVQADIPVVLLSFPRLVQDADYLFSKLAPVLPSPVPPEVARTAHRDTAHPDKVRVTAELHPPAPDGFALDGPGPDRLERAALLRIIQDLRRAYADTNAALQAASAAEQDALAAQAQDQAHRHAAESAVLTMAGERDRMAAERDAARADRAKLTEALTLAEKRIARLQADTVTMARQHALQVDSMRARLDVAEAPRGWRRVVLSARARLS